MIKKYVILIKVLFIIIIIIIIKGFTKINLVNHIIVIQVKSKMIKSYKVQIHTNISKNIMSKHLIIIFKS